MFQEFTYMPVFGKPLILYLGFFTLIAFLLTASIPVMNKRGFHMIPFKWHPRFAAGAICLAMLHGALGMLAYL
jgi:hypothetical protein